MKKIVSLALSTAMALSMFASVSSAATMTTQEKYDALVTQGIFAGYPNGQAYLDKDMTRAEFAKVVALLTNLDTTATGTNSYQDKNYANAWYKSYVEAVTKAGYMKGTTTGAKKLFNPNGKVTVQEMAATLVRAAKLEIPTTGINNTASAWAKGEVQAAINAGLVSGTANFSAAATRGLLVDTAYAYQTAVVKPAVTSYEVTDNGATVVFTLVNGEKVTVKPATALKPNVATTVTFTYAGKEYSESVTWKVTTATAATAAAATNLKEVDVTFNGEVNALTAEDAGKYAITSLASDAVESADLLEGSNVVRLTLKDGVKFVNQNDYTVTVTGVTAGTTTLPTASLTFRPLDNVLPTVQAVKGLGTKAVKVTFSEPVDVVNSNNFQVNGVAFVGSVAKAGNDREVILRPYTAFPVGTHTLTSSLVTDYAGLKSLSGTNEFTVAVDTEGPTVTEIQATLEKAVITFNEDVDMNTVARTDFYWVSGTTNHYANSVKQISGNKYEITFNEADRLPAAATTLFIDSVSDYSGNVNTVKQFTVNATVDQTRPVVTEVKFNNTNDDTLTVKFSKKVQLPANGSFVITNASGTVQPVELVSLDAAGTTATVNFVNDNLASGSYTLNVSGVKDTTLLQNTIEPYKANFSVGDTVRPKVSGDVYGVNSTTANSTITISFNEAMDPTTLSDPNNYLLTLANGGGQVRLPSTSNIRIANDYKSVVITLPSTINNQPAKVGAVTPVVANTTYVTQISLIGLEDAGDNLIENAGTALPVVITASATITGVKQTNENTIEVTFNQAIENASTNAFAVTGTTVSGVTVSGNTVTLTTANLGTNSNVTVNVADPTRIQTVSGIAAAASATPVTATDAVAPKVPTTVTSLVYTAAGIQLPFSENLSATNAGLIAEDLIVLNTVTGDRVSPQDYTTTVVPATATASAYVNIVLDADVAGRQFSVAVRANAVYLKDATGNVAAAQGPFVTRAFQ
ncbi:S-layer homology domain-containing protein [Saccharibacillus deserti]|uniref:S-layer homology domain-containing protein n=1 Tax=Saccharibacillus deserti TaxID=1634444 RepID=UPI0015575677|nr:S-layer homology domain-containing protein [Saccharibacillus deserti]